VPLLACLLLGQMAVAMVLSSRDDAPTFDEPVHMAAGIGYLRFGELRLNYEHPPLAKALSGVPLVLADVNLPDRASFARTGQARLGQQILYEQGNPPDRVLLLARLPMMALTLVLAGAIFGFARDLFGAAAALIPLGFVTVDPNVLGHGRLVTTDVAVTLFLLLTVWAIWRAVAYSPRWLIAAGVAFGLALSAKYTALLAAPLVAALVLLAMVSHSTPGRRLRWLAAGVVWLLVVAALAVAVVWAVYLAIDPTLSFHVTPRPVDGLLAAVIDRLPLPKPYRTGLRYVLFYDQLGRRSFLFGQRYRGGDLAFYPVMLAVKNPVVTLVAWAGAVSAILLGGHRQQGHPEIGTSDQEADPTRSMREPGRAEPRAAATGRAGLLAALLALPAWMFALAVLSDTNIGYRHILVVPAFLAVATGALARLRVRGRWVGVAAVALMLLAGVSAWRIYPSYLSYTSELLGGPDRGYRLVADSNLDWGQDLARAARYVREEHPRQRTYLLYFGSARPSAYGLDAVDLRKLPRWDLDDLHGVVLASASVLDLYEDPRFDELLRRKPVDQIGHSILVYTVG
jgi:4-amino-4-deoxy-L-arabinose transferase-like glycosyltransferase